ncbi:hypothetical protein M433DRAFT_150078 [Acidomyces richmondensis BFW]|nr:MAG: hypothetical protein FE78DRAFT_88340 [Acidomyces sp. 'richmondensis']KYG49398.1 hypothetical protein M433DRAFT_150078 [Acidomyces richmondensis BFW]
MGSSAKKRKEKKADFVKPKLKVGKTRPKNTNATDTSFTAKSIVLKQQSVSSRRNSTELVNHNISLLGSKNETQRRDALQYLTTIILIQRKDGLPLPTNDILVKAQPLVLDGSPTVRRALLKLLKAVPPNEIGNPDQLLLYARAGMTHLSPDIRLDSLEVLDWLLETKKDSIMSCPGAWIKTLRTFQNALGWHSSTEVSNTESTSKNEATEKWTSSTIPRSVNVGLGSGSKLFVHQLTTLAHFLLVGMTTSPPDPAAASRRAAEIFPLCQTGVHLISRKSNPFAYLNLFSTTRDLEGESFQDAEERVEVFNALGFMKPFQICVKASKREGGEVGRAGAAVEKALRLADVG